MRIAVLLTCHNRKEMTLTCIDAVSGQRLPPNTDVSIYLVDDGCSDGTPAAVSERFPAVTIIPGDGNLYWCGGMRLAWAEAMTADYDAYVWVNDDTYLFPTAIALLIESYRAALALRRPGIIVGSVCDPDDGRLTYGGARAGRRIAPSADMQNCETMNGNVVLVPREVVAVVGNLSPDFRHSGGDEDYALRAQMVGFEIWVAPGFLGHCRPNRCPPWCDPAVPFSKRWRSLHSPKGQPPRENYIFYRRYYRLRWPIALLKLYLRVVAPGPWNVLKRITGRV